ncbi:hypothetical protein ACETIH_01525 [Microvirga arabica]|uniref:Uncharacterized protein n=1 Tax=Microvirga arabica TaxID=1128671 RepID=A0ABV6Y2E2_9HYPH
MMEELKAAGAALTSLKAAFDLSKAFLDVKGAVDIQGKVFELQRVILSAQQDALKSQEAQSALLQRIRELENKLAEIGTWEAEKQRYALVDYGGGTLAYELKAEAANGEPYHRLCPSCFQRGQKSILQFSYKTSAGQDHYLCHACKADYDFGVKRHVDLSPRGGSWMSV